MNTPRRVRIIIECDIEISDPTWDMADMLDNFAVFANIQLTDDEENDGRTYRVVDLTANYPLDYYKQLQAEGEARLHSDLTRDKSGWLPDAVSNPSFLELAPQDEE